MGIVITGKIILLFKILLIASTRTANIKSPENMDSKFNIL